MSPIVQCAHHPTPSEGCRSCHTARLVNEAAETEALRGRIATLERRLARVLTAARTSASHLVNARALRTGVWSRTRRGTR